ncbi:hypothetical protein B0A52_03920 [Exophiala mesophila]|uniref:Histidine kinase n=1 Tax=Exophiala mesophila TaxID=212818 RepID=A0A438N7V3_EXOME|nr:hypothetical protein B0A52_03920 [Exophiala mesophila]
MEIVDEHTDRRLTSNAPNRGYGITDRAAPDGRRESVIHVNVKGVTHEAIFNPSTRQWDLIDTQASQRQTSLQSQVSLPKPDSHNRDPAPSWATFLPREENRNWLLNCVDWSRTELGPMETWPVSLRTAVGLVMADTNAAVVYWGPSLCACFNKRGFEDVGSRIRDPSQMQGVPFTECWKDVWPDVSTLHQAMLTSIEGFESMQMTVYPPRQNGRYEETFWTGSILPIVDESGKISGFYNRAIEVTNERVRERRSNTLYEIAAAPDDKTISIWDHVFRALRHNEQDFPMAFAYSAEDTPAECKLTLQQSFGLPAEGHPLVPEHLDIHDPSGGFAVFYRKVRTSNKPLVLRIGDDTLPEEMLDGFQWQGYREPPEGIVLMPISVSSKLLGIVVFGLNPRRAYSDDDAKFINTLCRQASATIAFVIDREESHQRAQRLTRQLARNERIIREMAEHGPVGMLRVSMTGNIVWANRQYYEITGHPYDDHYEFSFLDPLHPDDKDTVTELWNKMADSLEPIDVQVRLRHTWRPPPTAGNANPDEEPRWIIGKAGPLIEDGEVMGVAATVIDISSVKWAEEVQSRLATQATEARKLQEAFIDIVSHEMRNPLSAITQLADGIAGTLGEWAAADRSPDIATRLLQENTKSGKTILICAAHQKRVIDDVLTLSKLDSQLLSISPIADRPQGVVEAALKMFQVEFESHSIALENVVDESDLRCGVDWAMLDPARLTQVFINLLTNAIKFTKSEGTRRITVRQSAFKQRRPIMDDVIWFPTESEKHDLTLGAEWGSGEPVSLLFSITDTGKGLEQDEMVRLFGRFQQATKKTHIKYGGSGLGLFISRKLTESMGGEIGVASRPGQGSTFAFYIKARHTNCPETSSQLSRTPSLAYTSRRSSEVSDQIDWITRQLSNTSVAPRPQILLVEDNIINAQVLMKQLERAGCIVYVANHGQEALDFLPSSSVWHQPATDVPLTDIDCILMDVEMPVLDGLSCTREIRQLQSRGHVTEHVSIIAITANARVEQINDAFEAGVDAVLPKPFRVMDVLAKMDEIRAGKHWKRSGSKPSLFVEGDSVPIGRRRP